MTTIDTFQLGLFLSLILSHFLKRERHASSSNEPVQPAAMTSDIPEATVSSSEGNRRGWLRRFFSGWRWPWSRVSKLIV